MRRFCASSLPGISLTTFVDCLRRRAHSSSDAAAASAIATVTAGSQSSIWVTSNSLYRKHPRLLILEACGRSTSQLGPILAYTIVSGLFRNPFVASRVLHLCCSVDVLYLSYAALVFNHMEQPNIFSWNTIIKSFAEADDHCPSVAFAFYQQMLERRIPDDKYTYPFLLKACRSASGVNVGKLVHAHCLVFGFSMDSFVQTALVNMYLRCGGIEDAHMLFDRMPTRDVVSWTGVISGLSARGYFGHALELFNSMRKDDFSVRPNVATMVSVTFACAGLGSLDYIVALHAHLEKVGFVADIFVGNSLIDAYAKCGSMHHSYNFFQLMEERDLHSWTAIIMGLATHGMAIEALALFANMKYTGLVPDSVTFVAVLSACSHAGLVDQGVENFVSMERDYKIVPELKHYGCMVDLFSRAGLLEHAYTFISRMPVKPNLAVLGALLSACRAQNKLELAEAITHIIESSCEYKGGAHVLLSNMYANRNKWHEVALIRKRVIGDMRKPPGQSCIEVKGVIHKFMVEHNPTYISDIREMRYVLDTSAATVNC